MEWLIGLAGSGLIAGLAYWKGSLTGSGAASAVVVGTTLYALGSPMWFVLMIGFFVSSSLWTRVGHRRKQAAEAVYQKSGRRDAGQVWANGGLGVFLVLFHGGDTQAWWPAAAYIGVMATVTADTWATELGGLSRGNPRSVLTWRPVPKGTSGGISLIGSLAAAAGAAFIGLLALVSGTVAGGRLVAWEWLVVPGIAMLAGWLGAMTDSVLGAVLQRVYRCEVCGREVEAASHCGRPAAPLRGWRWMDNDTVNVLSSAVGGVLAVLMMAPLWQ